MIVIYKFTNLQYLFLKINLQNLQIYKFYKFTNLQYL